ncbi:MAG TPA: hypothetical protein VM580_11035, partial [Labilithrix sp.]|nr:hypothetical protein [Labilithrix sp.]
TSCALTAEPSPASTSAAPKAASGASGASGASPAKSSSGCSLAMPGDAGRATNAPLVGALACLAGTLAARRRKR